MTGPVHFWNFITKRKCAARASSSTFSGNFLSRNLPRKPNNERPRPRIRNPVSWGTVNRPLGAQLLVAEGDFFDEQIEGQFCPNRSRKLRGPGLQLDEVFPGIPKTIHMVEAQTVPRAVGDQFEDQPVRG